VAASGAIGPLAWNASWNDFIENCVRLVLSVHTAAASVQVECSERRSFPLNPRVRGTSPWRRTRSELVFLPFLYPRRRPFLAMFAPRLLVSPNIVDHARRTPRFSPCRWLYAA